MGWVEDWDSPDGPELAEEVEEIFGGDVVGEVLDEQCTACTLVRFREVLAGWMDVAFTG